MQKKSGWPKPYPKLNLITEEVVASRRRSVMDGRSSGSSCWWHDHRLRSSYWRQRNWRRLVRGWVHSEERKRRYCWTRESGKMALPVKVSMEIATEMFMVEWKQWIIMAAGLAVRVWGGWLGGVANVVP